MGAKTATHYVTTCLLTAVLPKLDTPHHLLVDEVRAHWVLRGVVPGSKDLLAEEEPPWSVSLLGPHLLGILLTLGNGVHDVIPLTPKTGYLDHEEEMRIIVMLT